MGNTIDDHVLSYQWFIIQPIIAGNVITYFQKRRQLSQESEF